MQKHHLAPFLLALAIILAIIPIKTTQAATILSDSGNTIVVTSLKDTHVDGVLDLREAIAQSSSGDLIVFDSSIFSAGYDTITLHSDLITLFIGRDLTIQGPGMGGLIIKSTGGPVFVVQPGVTANISDLTIQRGSGLQAEGIQNNGTLNLTNVDFDQLVFYAQGAAIFNHGGSLTVTNCTFSANRSAVSGGAISSDGTLVINNSQFTGNSSADYGGALYVGSGTATVNASTFSNNITSDTGGAIDLFEGSLQVNNSTFNGNSVSEGSGGAIGNYLGTLAVSLSTFSQNVAQINGGALVNGCSDGCQQDVALIQTSLFNSNISQSLQKNNGGGAVYNMGQLTIFNSTITDNIALTADGNGILNGNAGGNLTLYNSTIYDNRPGLSSNTSQGIDNHGVMTMGSTIVDHLQGGVLFTSLGNNIMISSSVNTVASDQTGITDPLLNPLASYDGATQTMSPMAGSPAIGMGNCNLPSPAAAVTGDQRGHFRKSPACDVGAYETAYDPIVHNTNDHGGGSLRLAITLCVSCRRPS